jgi:hypothetical protein
MGLRPVHRRRVSRRGSLWRKRHGRAARYGDELDGFRMDGPCPDPVRATRARTDVRDARCRPGKHAEASREAEEESRVQEETCQEGREEGCEEAGEEGSEEGSEKGDQEARPEGRQKSGQEGREEGRQEEGWKEKEAVENAGAKPLAVQ